MIMASKVPNQCWQFIVCVVACDAPRGLPKNSSRRTRWHHVEVWEWGPSSMIRVICSTSMHHVVLYSIFVHRIISDASWKLVFVAKWWLSHDARRIAKKREKSHHAHRDRAVVERRPGEIPVFERNSGFWSVLARHMWPKKKEWNHIRVSRLSRHHDDNTTTTTLDPPVEHCCLISETLLHNNQPLLIGLDATELVWRWHCPPLRRKGGMKVCVFYAHRPAYALRQENDCFSSNRADISPDRHHKYL